MAERAQVIRKARRVGLLGAAGAGVCLVLAACSPVKMGAAAIVGDQRITTASLDIQVANLETAAKPYADQITMTSADATSAVLTWLIRFDVMDQVAANAGITVTQAEIAQGTTEINEEAEGETEDEEEEGVSITPAAVLVDAGISPELMPLVARYQAQDDAYESKATGGKAASSLTTAEETTLEDQFDKDQCTAAKQLNIQVSPQFGRWDYATATFSVVASANVLSAPEGTPSPASTEGLTAAAC